jgi:hypothetical protein
MQYAKSFPLPSTQFLREHAFSTHSHTGSLLYAGCRIHAVVQVHFPFARLTIQPEKETSPTCTHLSYENFSSKLLPPAFTTKRFQSIPVIQRVYKYTVVPLFGWCHAHAPRILSFCTSCRIATVGPSGLLPNSKLTIYSSAWIYFTRSRKMAQQGCAKLRSNPSKFLWRHMYGNLCESDSTVAIMHWQITRTTWKKKTPPVWL